MAMTDALAREGMPTREGDLSIEGRGMEPIPEDALHVPPHSEAFHVPPGAMLPRRGDDLENLFER